MSLLYARILAIRDWYFDQITNKELYTFYTMDVRPDKEYTFEELMTLMTTYAKLLKKEGAYDG